MAPPQNPSEHCSEQPFPICQCWPLKRNALSSLDLVQHPHFTDEETKPRGARCTKQPLALKNSHRLIKVSHGAPQLSPHYHLLFSCTSEKGVTQAPPHAPLCLMVPIRPQALGAGSLQHLLGMLVRGNKGTPNMMLRRNRPLPVLPH